VLNRGCERPRTYWNQPCVLQAWKKQWVSRPKRGYPSLENQRVSRPKRGLENQAEARLPKQQKQRVSRLKRRYPTTGKLMRLCHSMASDSPSERSYIGRMNTVKNHQCEGNFLEEFGCTEAIVNSEFVF
jgi:hypothetical protein